MHIIDLSAAPFNPWSAWMGAKAVVVEEHRASGQWKFDPTQIKLHLAEGQKNGIQGHKLRKKLMGRPVCNANLLDYLLAHPELIPEDWKRDGDNIRRRIFFWGTVYRDNRDNNLYVRYLFWDGDAWRWGDYGLVCAWFGHCPAALYGS